MAASIEISGKRAPAAQCGEESIPDVCTIAFPSVAYCPSLSAQTSFPVPPSDADLADLKHLRRYFTVDPE